MQTNQAFQKVQPLIAPGPELPRHIVSASQFTPELLKHVFNLAKEIEEFWAVCHGRLLSSEKELYDYKEEFLERHGVRGRKMFIVFYEASTRTRASFAAAWDFLGGQIPFYTENAKVFSSAAKGETLEDTIRVLASYGPDVIVLRHDENGAAKRASSAISCYDVSIISAGDGSDEHPTQALLDLYTIHHYIRNVEGISIAFMGDVARSRTIRSLAMMLAKYPGVRMYFCAPKITAMDDDLRIKLRAANVEFYEQENNWESLISDKVVNVLYQTRLQEERFKDASQKEEAMRLQPRYTITPEIGRLMNEKRVLLMHPLPRVNEIHLACDLFETSIYFSQAQLGLFVRMALLSAMLRNRRK